uniref:Aspartic peptidase DDI1-type domain-containing protein n=1 Tax=Romanomermis culicivorax TaxID=13658 RepID=A0A915JBN5_ROMCU
MDHHNQTSFHARAYKYHLLTTACDTKLSGDELYLEMPIFNLNITTAWGRHIVAEYFELPKIVERLSDVKRHMCPSQCKTLGLYLVPTYDLTMLKKELFNMKQEDEESALEFLKRLTKDKPIVINQMVATQEQCPEIAFVGNAQYGNTKKYNQTEAKPQKQLQKAVEEQQSDRGSIIHLDKVRPQEKVQSKDLTHVKYGRQVMDQEKRLLENYPKMVPFHINVIIGEMATRALIDTGAQCMVMSAKLLKKALDVNYTVYLRILKVTVADGKIVHALGYVPFCMKTEFEHFPVNAIVLPDAGEDLHLGTDFLAHPDLAVIIDFKRNAMTIQGIEKSIDVVQLPSVTTMQMVVEEAPKYRDVFSLPGYPATKTSALTCKKDTGKARPVAKLYYTAAINSPPGVRQHIKEMLDQGDHI